MCHSLNLNDPWLVQGESFANSVTLKLLTCKALPLSSVMVGLCSLKAEIIVGLFFLFASI